MLLTEIRIDLKTGTMKTRSVGGSCEANPLKEGAIPADFAKRFDWERWRVGDGVIHRVVGQNVWVPFTGTYSPGDDLNYPLAKLSEDWKSIHSASTMGSARKRAANGGVLPPVAYPPLKVTAAPAETTEVHIGKNGLRIVTTEGGIVIRSVYARNDVIMDIVENKFVESFDLSPPSELLDIFDRSAKEREAARRKNAP
jgi:hypothetical protein